MREYDPEVKWFTTCFFPKRSTGRPERFEDGVLPRLREPNITFIIPWGPRYRWRERGTEIHKSDVEVKTLKYLAGMMGELREKMPSKVFSPIFIGADLYGVRINNLPPEIVAEYYNSLSAWVQETVPSAEFLLWSEFDSDVEIYRQKYRGKLMDYLSQAAIEQARVVARKMGNNGSPEEYLTERLAEADFLEKLLNPIKISCVRRSKDDEVDLKLPRLYLVPESLHAPWL